ncbi:MAG: hypothetical protein JG764_1494 [Clostridiales bacterium]|jgi:hypothetical protein|nr:hypothetical protein [Clostridiales bacterium]
MQPRAKNLATGRERRMRSGYWGTASHFLYHFLSLTTPAKEQLEVYQGTY